MLHCHNYLVAILFDTWLPFIFKCLIFILFLFCLFCFVYFSSVLYYSVVGRIKIIIIHWNIQNHSSSIQTLSMIIFMLSGLSSQVEPTTPRPTCNRYQYIGESRTKPEVLISQHWNNISAQIHKCFYEWPYKHNNWRHGLASMTPRRSKYFRFRSRQLTSATGPYQTMLSVVLFSWASPK
jgi:hypothetical protein